MPVEHIPMYGANDEPLEVYEEGSFPENVTVPLVIYVNGERKVVGEATINKGQVSVVLGDDVAEEVVGLVVGRPDEAQFSFGFSKYPDPYREPYIDLSMIRGKFGRPVEDEPPRDFDIDNPIPLPPYKKRFFDELPSKDRTEYLIPEEKYDEAFPLLLDRDRIRTQSSKLSCPQNFTESIQ